MDSIEKVEPQIINGVEFYVNADLTVAGCSRPAIAALCGVARQSLDRLIEVHSQQEASAEKPLKGLKALLSEPYYPQLIGANGAKILKEEACIAIIEYYAFYSPSKSEVALFSFRKFAAMGWKNWVLDVTGHSTPPIPHSLVGAIREELVALRGEIRELTNVKRIAQTSHPGLGTLVEEYGQELLLPPVGLKEPFTFNRWLTVTNNKKRDGLSLRRRLAECVKTLRGVRHLKHKGGQVLYWHTDLPAFRAAMEVNEES